MRTSMLIATLLTFSACTSDADQDGLTNSEEAELGTDPMVADTDGDGLSDYREAIKLGTDPLHVDTDLDGFSDGDEIAAETDPLQPLSYLRSTEGVWPDLRAHADDSTTEGWGVGDRYKNVSASDQFGQQVDLYQFYGNVVLLDFSAGWCAPCRAVAKTAEAEYRERADDGFVIVHMMFEDYSGNLPTKGFLQTWAAASRLTFPVIYDPSVEDNLDGLYESGLYKGSIPFMILLDRDMTIVQAVKGSNQVDDLLSTADELLAR